MLINLGSRWASARLVPERGQPSPAHGPESKHDGWQLPWAPIWTASLGARTAAPRRPSPDANYANEKKAAGSLVLHLEGAQVGAGREWDQVSSWRLAAGPRGETQIRGDTPEAPCSVHSALTSHTRCNWPSTRFQLGVEGTWVGQPCPETDPTVPSHQCTPSKSDPGSSPQARSQGRETPAPLTSSARDGCSDRTNTGHRTVRPPLTSCATPGNHLHFQRPSLLI